jgi:hypothetical protein
MSISPSRVAQPSVRQVVASHLANNNQSGSYIDSEWRSGVREHYSNTQVAEQLKTAEENETKTTHTLKEGYALWKRHSRAIDEFKKGNATPLREYYGNSIPPEAQRQQMAKNLLDTLKVVQSTLKNTKDGITFLRELLAKRDKASPPTSRRSSPVPATKAQDEKLTPFRQAALKKGWADDSDDELPDLSEWTTKKN